MGYDFIPAARGAQPIHKDVTYELEQYPVDKTEPRLEKHVAPAIRGHMKNLLENMASRGRPVSDIEEGHISSSCCILANLSMQLGRTLAWDAREENGEGRRRGQPPAATAVSQAVDSPGGQECLIRRARMRRRTFLSAGLAAAPRRSPAPGLGRRRAK